MDRHVSDSLHKVSKYLLRLMIVVFVGWLALDSFHLISSDYKFIGKGVWLLTVVLFVLFFAFHLMNVGARFYENDVERGIEYINDIKTSLDKIRINIFLSDKELAEKTKIKASVDIFGIDLKQEHISAIQELRDKLVEKEEMLQIKLMEGYRFPKKPPRIYVFWRKKVLGIPPMTVGGYSEVL